MQGHDAHMAILKIARMGHPVLLQKCEPVADPGAPEIRRLVADMMETMMDAPGVGLAAPQVYQPLRLFVFRIPGGRETQDPDDIHVGNTRADQPHGGTDRRGARAWAGKAACRSPACARRCRGPHASVTAASTATAT